MISSVLFTSPAFLVTSLVAIVLYVGVVFLRKSRSLSHLPHAEGDLQNESMGSIMNNAIEKVCPSFSLSNPSTMFAENYTK